jgi:lysophospholipase L1-like esterase
VFGDILRDRIPDEDQRQLLMLTNPTMHRPTPTVFSVHCAMLIVVLSSLAPTVLAQDSPGMVDTLRIVILGSSTATGMGASTPDSSWVQHYRHWLADSDTTVRVVNLSVPGYTTYHFLPVLDSTLRKRPLPDTSVDMRHALAMRPSAILVNLPSNDAAWGFDTTEQRANYRRLSAMAQSDSVPLWVCTPQPRNLKADKRRLITQMRAWITETFGERCIDFWTGLGNADGTLRREFDSGDGTHLNDKGHRLLFDRVVAANLPGSLRAQHEARAVRTASPSENGSHLPENDPR